MQGGEKWTVLEYMCFKPYYKWITFNINIVKIKRMHNFKVLNLIINGLPSI